MASRFVDMPPHVAGDPVLRAQWEKLTDAEKLEVQRAAPGAWPRLAPVRPPEPEYSFDNPAPNYAPRPMPEPYGSGSFGLQHLDNNISSVFGRSTWPSYGAWGASSLGGGGPRSHPLMEPQATIGPEGGIASVTMRRQDTSPSSPQRTGGPPVGAYGLYEPMLAGPPHLRRDPGSRPPWEIEPVNETTLDEARNRVSEVYREATRKPVSLMTVPEIVREAEAQGMTPATYYAANVPDKERDPQMIHTLAYELPTPSNGETYDQAAARMTRMQRGYANGQPVPPGMDPTVASAVSNMGLNPARLNPNDFVTAHDTLNQFRNRTGPRNPETATDLAALDARAARYAQAIRGHGGSSDFDPNGAYGQAASGMGPGLPEERRMQAQRMALMSPSERALLASSPRRSPVQDMLAGAAGPTGAAGAAGAPGRETMTPEEALARLVARKGGEATHRGYMPANIAAIVDERTAPPTPLDDARRSVSSVYQSALTGHPTIAPYPDDAGTGMSREKAVEELFGRYTAGRGKIDRKGKPAMSAEYAAELADREAKVKARGIARGKTVPSDILQDQMAMNFLQRNPAVMQEVIRLHGQNLDRGAAQLERDMEAQLKREEMQMRQGLGNDALKLQQMQALIDGGMSPEEAQAAIYGGGAAPLPAPGGAAPADLGLTFSTRETADLTDMSPDDIAAYGRARGWSNEKTTRAIRKFGGTAYGSAERPGGWTNFLRAPLGDPLRPGEELEFGGWWDLLGSGAKVKR